MRPARCKERLSRRGMAIIFSLSVVALLGVLGSSMLLRSTHENQLGIRSAARQSAFFLAEAGVDQAVLNLRTPTDLTDDITAGALLTGTFQISSPPEDLGNMRWRVIATGVSQQEQRSMEAVFQLTPQSVFQFALFGDQQVNVSGHGITDSYDSRDGSYSAATHEHNGDVGTNTAVSGGVTVGGSIFVDGQVVVGPDVADPVSVVTGYDPAFITGGTSPPSDTQDVVSQPYTFPMPSVTVPPGLVCNDLTVNGNSTLTLPAGTYCYHNLTIEGGADLTTSGSVTIYLTGQLNARGNSSMGVPSDPQRMVILMTPTGDATIEQGTITGSTEFYGALYGPDSTITITGNAEVYGSIIAERVNLTGSAEIHYDEALTDVTTVSNLFQTAVASWREL